MKYKFIIGVIFLLPILAFLVGCKIVSGSFVIVETLSFTTQTGFYPESIDLDDNEDWAEHSAELDKIEVIGFELWITNNEPSEWTYSIYIDDLDPLCVTEPCFDASSTKRLIFGPLTVAASTGPSGTEKIVSYANSFNYLPDSEYLIDKVQTGEFNLYGIATGGGSGDGGIIDTLKLVITVNANES